VHLAYASTVHGIQGETTDVSIVGSGVDAAGLYVGMTRGRSHNEAIAIAGSDSAAVDKVADSMLRGVPEVSVEDSQRTARAELGRAARPLADAPSTGDELMRLDGWLRKAERVLLDLDGRVASGHARTHGRTAGGGSVDDLEEARRDLAARYGSEVRRRESLARQHWEPVHRTPGEHTRAVDQTASTSDGRQRW
jgi:hypothetical protein